MFQSKKSPISKAFEEAVFDYHRNELEAKKEKETIENLEEGRSILEQAKQREESSLDSLEGLSRREIEEDLARGNWLAKNPEAEIGAGAVFNRMASLSRRITVCGDEIAKHQNQLQDIGKRSAVLRRSCLEAARDSIKTRIQEKVGPEVEQLIAVAGLLNTSVDLILSQTFFPTGIHRERITNFQKEIEGRIDQIS